MKSYNSSCEQVYYPLEQALEYLNDLHPYEVDTMSSDKSREASGGIGEVCDSLDIRRKRALTCAEGKEAMYMPGCRPPRPAAFFYDGRLMNQLKERRFLASPCRHWRTVSPWQPQPPTILVPNTGHYKGLGKPPKEYFRLREMRILGNRAMPSYQLLRPDEM